MQYNPTVSAIVSPNHRRFVALRMPVVFSIFTVALVATTAFAGT